MPLRKPNSVGSYFCRSVATRLALPLSCLAAVGSPVAGGGGNVWIIIKFEDCHPQEHEISLPVLLVAGSVDNEVDAALNPVQGRKNKFQVGAAFCIFAYGVPVNHDGHVADKVSHAHCANGLSHAVITCRKLLAHVLTESTQNKIFIRFPKHLGQIPSITEVS